jgi:PAS domain S-box-containing protein
MKKATILIVEDETVVARDIWAQLLELGYEPVGHATQGVDAIRLAGQLRPSLVLMDIGLAGEMDGIACAQVIRAQFALPVVFLTAFAADDFLERAKLTEPFGYILKPFTQREVRTVIEMALYKHQSETKTLAAKNRLQAMLDAMPDLLFEVGLDGRIYDYHSNRTDLLLVPPAQFMGRLMSEFLPAPAAETVLAALREAALKGASRGSQYSLLLPEGERWFELSVAPLLALPASERHFIFLAHDITERKNAQDLLRETSHQLQTLSARVLQAQEIERRRIAIELHDELGQSLTALKINLQANARFKNRPTEEVTEENLRIVEDVLQHVRRLALALRPSMLDDLGLVPALRWMAEQNSERSGFGVEFQAVRLPDRLTPEIETACFRIAQEALTNVVRYAQAKHVQLEMTQQGQTLCLLIQDDGCGFDLADMKARALSGSSIGVLGMQERAALIGGQLVIESAPGQGTRVRLHCPLRLRGALA